MFLSNKNKHLHDIQNFDRYNNVYAVRVNEAKIDSITYDLLNDGSLRHRYNVVQKELLLYFAVDEDISIKGYYKIIYGHFYNNSNDFLYKKLYNNNKAFNVEVFRCRKNELLHDNLRKYLIYSDSYDTINRQLLDISEERVYEIKQHFVRPFDVLYNEEVVSIVTNEHADIAFSFDEECVYIKDNKD